MWLTAVAPPKQEAQAKEIEAKQRQLSELAEEVRNIFDRHLNNLGVQLQRIEQIRFDPKNTEGIISEGVQQKAHTAYDRVQEGVEKIGEMIFITTHHHIKQENPYTKPFNDMLETMKSIAEYFRKLSQPIVQRTAEHGIRDQAKARMKVDEFIQEFHPEPRPHPWPMWLKSLWRREKPTEQFSSAKELVERLRSNAQKIVEAPQPELGFHITVSPQEFLEHEKVKKKRQEMAKKVLEKPSGIPENVKHMYEVFYPAGIKWHIEPEVPVPPPPHKEKREEYAHPHQRPGWTPKVQVR